MLIYGYGEDFLTLWFVLKKIEKIIDDGTDPEKATIFYRPSFGRSGKSDDKVSSQFGEFDAIVITEKTVYPIESKWDGTLRNANKAKKLVLVPHQVDRHRIFEWYVKNWESEDWENMPDEKVDDFTSQFKNNVIAPKASRLQQNLETILAKIRPLKKVKHLIVYFSKDSFPEIETDYTNIQFKKVEISYSPDTGHFLSLCARG